MAKKRAKRADETNEGNFVPPDRPDQIAIGDEEPEEVNIFEAARDDEPPAGNDEPNDVRARRSRENHEGTVLDRQPGQRERATRDDDDQYSKKVRRRINREYALRQRAEARLAEERAARRELEQRLAKLERSQSEEKTLGSIREIEAKIKEVAAKLAKAKEDNDTAAEVALDVELGDLQGQKVLLESQRQAQQQARQSQQDDAPTHARDDDEPAMPNRARSAEWMRAQRRWWNTARWRDARQDAVAHDETILAEINDGDLDFEPYSDEHFEELARRLKTDYPELEVRTIDGEVFEDFTEEDRGEARHDRRSQMREYDDDDEAPRSRAATNGRRAPMGGLGGRDGRRERSAVEMARRGKVELTQEDFAVMRTFKLDPNNPDHKKAFARERARTLLRTSNGARR